MNYETLAKDILGLVGGKANINEAWHCATRLRFKLKDENKAQTADIEALPGVVTVVKSAGQYQVVIGNSVAKVFEPLAAAAGLEHLDNQTHAPSDKPKENIVQREREEKMKGAGRWEPNGNSHRDRLMPYW